ncbi:hypothetical protein GN958_ATG21424, partial [Phytophthora infestans]
RRLRSKSINSSRPPYAQLTLSIEKDHSSDEDYKPDNEDIDVDIQSTERGVKCGDNTGHKDEDVSGEENKLVSVNKKEEEENKGSNPIKAKGTKRSRASQDNAASAPSIAGQTIENVVAPFPRVTIKTWGEFDTLLASYTKANNLHFRVRSSESAETYN